MTEAQYKQLVNYAGKVISDRGKRGLIVAEDIVADAYEKYSFKDVPEFKRSILNTITKNIYKETKISDESFKEKLRRCNKCKEDLPASNFYVIYRKDMVYISSQCKTCQRKYEKEYREKNKGRFLERDKKRQAEYNQRDYVKAIRSSRRYKDMMNENQRTYRKKNIEHHREVSNKNTIKYRERHPDKIKETAKKQWGRIKESGELLFKRREQNRIASKNYQEKKRITKWLSEVGFSDKKCFYCGYGFSEKSNRKSTIEHIVPKSKGGSNTYLNKCNACQECNGNRGDRPLEFWLLLQTNSVIKQQINKLIIYTKRMGKRLLVSYSNKTNPCPTQTHIKNYD